MVVVDRGHRAVAHANRRRILRVVRLRARPYRDLLYVLSVGPQLRRLRRALRRVTGLAQVIGDEFDVQLLPRANLPWSRKNLGRVGKQRLLQPRVHNPLVLKVVVARHHQEQHNAGRNRQQRHPQQQR